MAASVWTSVITAYAPVDMDIGPEDPRPFVELAAALGHDRIPWRAAIVLEGCGQSAMQLKDIGASFLSMFPGNADLRRAFAFLREAREKDNHISVRLRARFATWAPVEEPHKLRRRMSTLSQRIEGWGNAKATTVIGDPLEGVMSTAPGLALASTANPALALLGDALAMLPWNRTASPWEAAACCSAGRTAASGRMTRPADASARWSSISSSHRPVRVSQCWQTRSISASASARRSWERTARSCR